MNKQCGGGGGSKWQLTDGRGVFCWPEETQPFCHGASIAVKLKLMSWWGTGRCNNSHRSARGAWSRVAEGTGQKQGAAKVISMILIETLGIHHRNRGLSIFYQWLSNTNAINTTQTSTTTNHKLTALCYHYSMTETSAPNLWHNNPCRLLISFKNIQ